MEAEDDEANIEDGEDEYSVVNNPLLNKAQGQVSSRRESSNTKSYQPAKSFA